LSRWSSSLSEPLSVSGRRRFHRVRRLDGLRRLDSGRVAFGFTIARGKVVAVDLIADQERLGQLGVVILEE